MRALLSPRRGGIRVRIPKGSVLRRKGGGPGLRHGRRGGGPRDALWQSSGGGPGCVMAEEWPRGDVSWQSSGGGGGCVMAKQEGCWGV